MCVSGSWLIKSGCSIGGNGTHVKLLDNKTLVNYWKVCKDTNIFYQF
jgi:hypothetical protein